MTEDENIFVYAHWAGMNDPELVGALSNFSSGVKQVFEFEYDNEWLNNHTTLLLDPELRIFAGKFYSSNESKNFGMFTDSTPGSWGRALLRRYEIASARKEQRASKTMNEARILIHGKQIMQVPTFI